MNSKNVLLIILVSFIINVNAQTQDTLKNSKSHFELSFGQSLLFISNSKQINIRNEAAIVIPTTSVLFFIEFRPSKTLRIPAFFNMATESKQFIVNNQLINERASPTFGTGLIFKTLQFKIDSKSKIELEVGALSSFLVDSKENIRVAPILASRIRLMRGENFVMYFGGSYSVGINALGILYGTGTVF